MQKTTPATAFLDAQKIPYEFVTYDYDPSAERFGLQAAEAMGVDAGQVFKTLMIVVDEKPCVVLLPSNEEVDMKQLASLFNGKHARMMKIDEAERLSHYKVGGISPFGQRRKLPTLVEQSALLYEKIYVNGGGRGYQLHLKPEDAIAALDAGVAAFLRKHDSDA